MALLGFRINQLISLKKHSSVPRVAEMPTFKNKIRVKREFSEPASQLL